MISETYAVSVLPRRVNAGSVETSVTIPTHL